MSERLLHPSVSGVKNTFDGFIPFIAVNCSPRRQNFTQLLKDLFDITGQVWSPGGCFSTEYLDSEIKIIQRRGGLPGFTFAPYSFCDSHFFITAHDGSGKLIIDPFGVPSCSAASYHREPRLILPFFGEVQLSSEHHQIIYRQAHQIESGVFHHFHP